MKKACLIIGILSTQAFGNNELSARLTPEGLETRYEYVGERWGALIGFGNGKNLYTTLGLISSQEVVRHIEVVSMLCLDYSPKPREFRPKAEIGVRFHYTEEGWVQLGTELAKEPIITPAVTVGYTL